MGVEQRKIGELKIVQKPGGARWVSMTLEQGEWRPAFKEIVRVLGAIMACEDEKYRHGAGGDMARDLINDVRAASRRTATPEQWLDDAWFGPFWKAIASEYGLRV